MTGGCPHVVVEVVREIPLANTTLRRKCALLVALTDFLASMRSDPPQAAHISRYVPYASFGKPPLVLPLKC